MSANTNPAKTNNDEMRFDADGQARSNTQALRDPQALRDSQARRDTQARRNPFERLKAERPVFHCLRQPNNMGSAQLWKNLHYQMQWSVQTLESQLAEEGCPHVLQLNAYSCKDGDWRNPDRWHLYADGCQVAEGDGEQARLCFEQSAELFRDLCRESVEAAELDELTQSEYQLLCKARSIARFEPFDRGEHVAGAREGRV